MARRSGRSKKKHLATIMDKQVCATSSIDKRIELKIIFCTVATLNDDHEIYVVGSVGTTLDGEAFGGGSSDIVIIKYDTSGTKVWTRLIGTTGDEFAYSGV